MKGRSQAAAMQRPRKVGGLLRSETPRWWHLGVDSEVGGRRMNTAAMAIVLILRFVRSVAWWVWCCEAGGDQKYDGMVSLSLECVRHI